MSARPGLPDHDVSYPGFRILTERVASRLVYLFAFSGVTNQRETACAWSRKTGKPLCRAIVWDDARTKNVVAHFEQKLKTEGLEVKPGVFRSGESGIQALREL